jgi:uncharacterized protein YcbX
VLRVARLSIAPVRSLALDHPDSIELTSMGVVEDRRFFLIDHAGRFIDRLVSGALVQVSAHTNPDATWLRMAFPDGAVIDGPIELGEAVTASIYDRSAEGHVVAGPWAEALEPFAGRPVRVVRCDQPGGTREKNAISLVTDGSLVELARQSGQPSIDGRRFRMLLEIEGAAAHEEDGWIGGRIAIGGAVLEITKPDARCAITTQDPDTGVRDLDTLRTIIGYRGLREGRKADFGVLGEVAVPGRVRLGDTVDVLELGLDTFTAHRTHLHERVSSDAEVS